MCERRRTSAPAELSAAGISSVYTSCRVLFKGKVKYSTPHETKAARLHLRLSQGENG